MGTILSHVVGRGGWGPALVLLCRQSQESPSMPQGARMWARQVLTVTMLPMWKLRLRRGSRHCDIKVWPLSLSLLPQSVCDPLCLFIPPLLPVA